MKLPFAKMHGLGNDFMVLDLVTHPFTLQAEQIARWADRHTGVGFDQLLIVAPPEDPDVDFRYLIFNADGTEAEQCGNGARCVARFIARSGLAVRPDVRLQTSNGQIETRLLPDGQVEVDMGVPGLAPADIPCDGSRADSVAPIGAGWRYRLTDSAGVSHELITVSMGNPHGVILVDDLTAVAVAEVGARLTVHPFFPERANIGFCQVVDPGFIRLRVFERGVGETRACGTGACAAVVAGRLAGLLEERVKVSLTGGKARIRWPGPDTPVTMTGPATLVYEGEIDTN